MSPYPNGQSFSCKHNCYYCPNEPAHEGNGNQAQPRSYLYLEPAVQRANEQKFAAIGQMFSRLDNYYAMGHVCDKVEIIENNQTTVIMTSASSSQLRRADLSASSVYLTNFLSRKIFHL